MCKQLLTLSKPPFLSGGTVEQKRAHLKTYFRETWELYESLFSLIKRDEAYFLRPEPLRHPLIFYYGHTAVFYINKLILGKFIPERIAPHLESICAVGVDEMSWDDLKPDNYQWPDVDEVRAYRNRVKAQILDLIDNMPLELPIRQDSLAWIVLMGIEHERIHIETSSVIMRMLDLKYLKAHDDWKACTEVGNAPENELRQVSGKSLVLGKTERNDTYGWDNEFGELPVEVEDFEASKYLVSNGEFLHFIEAGGYQTPDLWTEEGQSWLSFTKAEMPRFWHYRDGQYWQRNLLQEIPLPLNWPVEVNYLEAKAFCNWKNQQSEQFIRLPTEAEWQVMRDSLDTDLPFWAVAPGNINLEHFASSCPVNSFKQGDFFDILGNVWQWTESPIDAFEGFKVHPLYDDFSTPTFDGQHNLIKGGSWISTGNEATRDSRYAFRRHFFQHAGFRYVASQSESVPITPVNCYETQPDISQMLHHHYNAQLSRNNDLVHLAELVASHCSNASKVLDLGCGTGRLSFELARYVAHVDGIDLTARHIQHALHFKEQQQLRYAMPVEGELLSYHEVVPEDLDLNDTLLNKVNFVQGDGHNLKPQFTDYDVIVCHRVIDAVYHPEQFLKSVLTRLNQNGLLLLSSDWQWQENGLAKDKWLGGFKKDGESQTSAEGVVQLLSEQCDLVSQSQLETRFQYCSRKTALIQNDVMLWRKK
ncbi:5-histidylcysteine sulfoxide synthase [Planctobacterium marinum]|uniref:SAM-dependent methyltransferase n=1 Tax=Planctobacterium marinum TaxID=1631968 RepID=A0AA48HNK2_9ALTE|nr:SAM-dependent methyltransferase [Planctobacterium marinum]